MSKSIIITSNSRKGENIFHCWNASQSFYVFTQCGKRGIDAAHSALNKMFGNIYMNITHSAAKDQIVSFFK